MRLFDQVTQVARVRHLSYRTEQAYLHWIERFIRFHGIRHPNTMGTLEAEAFLTHLALGRKSGKGSAKRPIAPSVTELYGIEYRRILGGDSALE